MHSKPLTYLACPYTSPSRLERCRRYTEVTDAFAALTKEKGWAIFSPITSSHPLHERGLDGDWRFWRRIDTAYLRVSKRMVVLTLPGWESSVGVQAEIKIAKKFKIPVFYMHPSTYTLTKRP